jgi:16S rRNA (adenine1518-N6/adenine1519-N6)-dimethyltransferase
LQRAIIVRTFSCCRCVVAKSFHPKLGQHFLADPRYRRLIVERLDIRSSDMVIEIGPGLGAMTEFLVARASQVVAIEVDSYLASKLRKKLEGNGKVELLEADILETSPADLCRRTGVNKCFVFGNLPYYITSPILHHLLQFAYCIRGMGLLVQREVAERVCAPPGYGNYGYLSVFVQLHSRPRQVLRVPPGVFTPPPKVQSALLSFEMAPRFPDWRGEERDRFLEFVKKCFARKRKSLLNNLGGMFPREHVEAALASLDLAPTIRAEQLSIEQLASLADRLA